jgi:hypothetical protein
MSQLSLLLPIPAADPETPSLNLELVPISLSLAVGERFYIVVTQGDRQWGYPLRFTRVAALWLLPKLQKYDWTLNDEDVPLKVSELHLAVESLLGGVA